MKFIKNIYDLLKIIKNIYLYLIFAIFFGVLGFICSIFIPVIPIYYLFYQNTSIFVFITIMILLPIFRGFFKYAEQWCNHYVAFSTLAILRDKIFGKIAKYPKKKIEKLDRGDLLNIITNDVEMLEVFYAHTITPILIALITNGLILFILFKINYYFGLLGFISYILVGVIIPILFAKKLTNTGENNRKLLSQLNNIINQAFLGLYEIKFLNIKKDFLDKINIYSLKLNKIEENIQKNQAFIQMLTTLIINLSILIYVLLMFYLNILSKQAIIGFVLFASSFAPLIALANLGSGLTNTIASAKRVLALLNETIINEKRSRKLTDNRIEIITNNLGYTYDKKNVLDNININMEQELLGVYGKSGSGKTTLLKLLMGYYQHYQGNILLQNNEVKEVVEKDLNEYQGYLEQDTYIFNDSILNNIKIGKQDASDEEVILACKKANIDEFIQNLNDKYETIVNQNSTLLSAGERQRIGLARIFLGNKKNIFLDEPTSNLDALNEGLVLKSIIEEKKERNIIIVSHRKSTLNICEKTMKLK